MSKTSKADKFVKSLIDHGVPDPGGEFFISFVNKDHPIGTTFITFYEGKWVSFSVAELAAYYRKKYP